MRSRKSESLGILRLYDELTMRPSRTMTSSFKYKDAASPSTNPEVEVELFHDAVRTSDCCDSVMDGTAILTKPRMSSYLDLRSAVRILTVLVEVLLLLDVEDVHHDGALDVVGQPDVGAVHALSQNAVLTLWVNDGATHPVK